ncbi:hypothetical protein ACFQ1M_09795 [Sungkyunkwania multivorans]|uniref:Uncharacterized protein n=1 Tax=Sungkyunkwania multivorans TaxID=1173618 RepID=A0ABW3CXI4_9FLAO
MSRLTKFEIAKAYFEDAAEKQQLDAITNANIAAGKIQLKEHAIVVAAQVASPGGTVSLFQANQNELVGNSSINNQKLPSGQNHLSFSLEVLYGVGLIAADAGNVDYSSALPADLKNADLLVLEAETEKLRIPIEVINGAKNSDSYFTEIHQVLLRAEKKIDFKIEFPAAGADFAPGAGNAGFVKVISRGMVTNDRS